MLQGDIAQRIMESTATLTEQATSNKYFDTRKKENNNSQNVNVEKTKIESEFKETFNEGKEAIGQITGLVKDNVQGVLGKVSEKIKKNSNAEDGLNDLRKRGVAKFKEQEQTEEKIKKSPILINFKGKQQEKIEQNIHRYTPSAYLYKVIFSLTIIFLTILMYVIPTVQKRIEINIYKMSSYLDFGDISFIFVFFPIVFFSYFVVSNRRWKNKILYIASVIYIGYGAPYYLFVFILSTIATYTLGKSIYEDILNDREAQAYGTMKYAIYFHITILFIFGFSNSYLFGLKNFLGGTFSLRTFVIPVGIVVYSLSAISYIEDVYRGLIVSNLKYLDVALYMGLFTRLLVGPFESPKKVITQIRSRETNIYGVGNGAIILAKGILEKCLVADNILYLFTRISEFESNELSAVTAWLGAFAALLGLYFKLKGYTDIARGISEMLGFNFENNFDEPFRARSILELKNRWMKSFFSWLREYVYIPLAMRSNSTESVYSTAIISIVMIYSILSGFGGRYIIGGIFLSICVLFEYSMYGGQQKVMQSTRGLVYTKIVMAIAAVFFGARNIGIAFKIIKSMFFLGNGVFDKAGLYYLKTYFIIFIILVVVSTPTLFSKIREWVEKAIEIGKYKRRKKE